MNTFSATAEEIALIENLSDHLAKVSREAGRENEDCVSLLRQLSLPADFWMFQFKVVSCSRSFSHKWTLCPCGHVGETARRRCPRTVPYKAVLCPLVKAKKTCPLGDSCSYAHNVFEHWLHPSRYKTRMCTFGANCNRPICFFAHNRQELRCAPAAEEESAKDGLDEREYLLQLMLAQESGLLTSSTLQQMQPTAQQQQQQAQQFLQSSASLSSMQAAQQREQQLQLQQLATLMGYDPSILNSSSTSGNLLGMTGLASPGGNASAQPPRQHFGQGPRAHGGSNNGGNGSHSNRSSFSGTGSISSNMLLSPSSGSAGNFLNDTNNLLMHLDLSGSTQSGGLGNNSRATAIVDGGRAASRSGPLPALNSASSMPQDLRQQAPCPVFGGVSNGSSMNQQFGRFNLGLGQGGASGGGILGSSGNISLNNNNNNPYRGFSLHPFGGGGNLSSLAEPDEDGLPQHMGRLSDPGTNQASLTSAFASAANQVPQMNRISDSGQTFGLANPMYMTQGLEHLLPLVNSALASGQIQLPNRSASGRVGAVQQQQTQQQHMARTGSGNAPRLPLTDAGMLFSSGDAGRGSNSGTAASRSEVDALAHALPADLQTGFPSNALFAALGSESDRTSSSGQSTSNGALGAQASGCGGLLSTMAGAGGEGQHQLPPRAANRAPTPTPTQGAANGAPPPKGAASVGSSDTTGGAGLTGLGLSQLDARSEGYLNTLLDQLKQQGMAGTKDQLVMSLSQLLAHVLQVNPASS